MFMLAKISRFSWDGCFKHNFLALFFMKTVIRICNQPIDWLIFPMPILKILANKSISDNWPNTQCITRCDTLFIKILSYKFYQFSRIRTHAYIHTHVTRVHTHTCHTRMHTHTRTHAHTHTHMTLTCTHNSCSKISFK